MGTKFTTIIVAIGITVLISGLMIFAKQTDGNGIWCFDACGPCSSYGTFYIEVDGRCILPDDAPRQDVIITEEKNSLEPESELETEQLKNFTLAVSNQSFDISPVDISVQIDGKVVIDRDFDVGNQHIYHEFKFPLTKGIHTIHAESIHGKAKLEKEFVVDKEIWGFLSFWYYENEHESPFFDFIVSESPLGFQ
ncbi:MAG: hypothetical protein ACT4NJ_00845 [Nitrosopumilaceae archaeon]